MSNEEFIRGEFILELIKKEDVFDDFIMRIGVRLKVNDNKTLIQYLKKGYKIINHIPEQLLYYSDTDSKW